VRQSGSIETPRTEEGGMLEDLYSSFTEWVDHRIGWD